MKGIYSKENVDEVYDDVYDRVDLPLEIDPGTIDVQEGHQDIDNMVADYEDAMEAYHETARLLDVLERMKASNESFTESSYEMYMVAKKAICSKLGYPLPTYSREDYQTSYLFMSVEEEGNFITKFFKWIINFIKKIGQAIANIFTDSEKVAEQKSNATAQAVDAIESSNNAPDIEDMSGSVMKYFIDTNQRNQKIDVKQKVDNAYRYLANLKVKEMSKKYEEGINHVLEYAKIIYAQNQSGSDLLRKKEELQDKINRLAQEIIRISGFVQPNMKIPGFDKGEGKYFVGPYLPGDKGCYVLCQSQ